MYSKKVTKINFFGLEFGSRTGTGTANCPAEVKTQATILAQLFYYMTQLFNTGTVHFNAFNKIEIMRQL
jgi:hypothetical protein